MLSRSSSAYQPLDSVAAMNQNEASTNKKSTPKGGGFETSGGGGAGEEPGADIHEMTSIAVISQNPLGSGATATISTLPVEIGGAAEPNRKSKLERLQGKGDQSAIDMDIAYQRSRNSDKAGWTNFHFLLCIGISGFFIFWVLLLCRMYLPEEYQLFNPEAVYYQNSSDDS